MSGIRLPETVEALPPSARAVYERLTTAGPLTHRDLVQTTGLPPRTVRYAVGRLKEAGVIGARCNLMDCRQCYFFVASACEGKAEYAGARTNVVFAGIREASYRGAN